MQPIFWQWGGLTISTYAVCMVLGLIAGTIASLSEARRQHIRSALVLDAILAAVVSGVIAARLGYVLINWVYYQDHAARNRALVAGRPELAGRFGGRIDRGVADRAAAFVPRCSCSISSPSAQPWACALAGSDHIFRPPPTAKNYFPDNLSSSWPSTRQTGTA